MTPNQKQAEEKIKIQPIARYGWYSPKMARIAGTVVYENEKGIAFTLTCVSDGPDSGTNWEDIEFRAMVTHFVCRSRRSPLDFMLTG